MSSISVDYDVLNQKGSPAWYSDTFANIPTPGYKGRMFISTDTFAFYRDNGTGWDLVGGPGTGTITGAGVSGQVTYFIGTDTIGGNNNLFYDITNSRLGIGTATPGAPLDIHTTGTAAQFNGTGVNNSFVLFQNAGSSKWRIGNLYNSGANDYQIFDVTNSTARLTIKNTGASTLIGTFTATSLIKSGGTSSQILLADGSTTPTSTFGAGSVTNVSALTLGTTGTDLTSSVVNSTTTPVITLNVPTASATNRGALSSADWTTFNNKQATLSLTTTGTSGAATLVGATLNIPNYTNVGTVTSVAALTLGTTGTDLSSSVANSTSTPVITLNVPTASATNRGALSSADWTTFNNKQATLSVTAPVVLTGATISMPAATTSVSGYLTSTDWNTFNSKTSNLGTVTDVVALTIGTTGIDITSTAVTTTTTPVITLNIPTASASNRGALSSTDWTIFNNKQATLSLTTTGTSGAATLVANTLNIPNYGSALSGYLPLSGGTLTGALFGTSASFSGNGFFGGATTFSGLAGGIALNGSTNSGINFKVADVLKGYAYVTSSGNMIIESVSGSVILSPSGSPSLTLASTGIATFTGTSTSAVIVGNADGTTKYYQLSYNNGQANSRSWRFSNDVSVYGDFAIQQSTTQTGSSYSNLFYLSNTGAATFNSSDANGWYGGFSNSGTNFAYMGATTQFANSGGTSTDFGIRSANALAFYTSGGNERMRITSGGYIEAQSPNRTGNNANLRIYSTDTQAANVGASIGLGGSYGAGNVIYGLIKGAKENSINNDSNGYMSFTVHSSAGEVERMRITSGGLVNINYSGGGTDQFVVSGPSNSWAGVFYGNSTTGQSYGLLSQGGTNSSDKSFSCRNYSGTDLFTIRGDGAATFNSTLGINGTSNNVRSGTYTPTLVAGTNCAATTAYPCQYMQVDKVVTVSGQVYGSATAVTTETQFTMSVPVGSNFTQVYQCGGTGRSAQGGVAPSGAGYVAFIQAVSTDTVRFSYTAPAVLGTGGNFWFSFTYQII